MNRLTHRAHVRGFTLIEALVALLVMAFGMLSLVSLQSMFARNADNAKQRTEAQRLAQEKLECLRSYTQIASAPTASANRNCMGALKAVDTWSELATVANDPLNPITSTFSNSSFTRSWTIGGAVADPFRPVTVTLAWTDRAGTARTYTVGSIISQSNPDDEGAIGFPLPQNSNLKRPKNRNLNIPVPALDVGGGNSVYQLSSTLAVVFNNDSGYVIQKCNTLVTVANYATLVGNGQCANYSAYIVAGYISGDSSWTSSLANTLPTGINTASVMGWDNSNSQYISCAYSPTSQATDQNTGGSVAGVYRYYLCVIPVTSGGTWYGSIRLAGMTTSNSSSRWLVCRFQYPASTLFPNDNERNVQPYTAVSGSLDSQNYYIVSGSSCPNISVTTGNGPSQQTFSMPTVLHQDCRTSNSANYATACPTAYSGP